MAQDKNGAKQEAHVDFFAWRVGRAIEQHHRSETKRTLSLRPRLRSAEHEALIH